ncbi:hypothetical protein [Streptomyces synnematoformans]|uniref:Lipoprotein n=1 Tax=Streptomyces synnematoformans TaxID=415721 RepID=A0ABN2XAH1_9ACTN
MSARTAAASAAAIAALALLAACGSDLHGTVTEKEYEPAKTSWKTVPETRQECTTSTKRSGKTSRRVRSCKDIQVGTKKVRHTAPACWEIELDHDRDVCVSKQKFEATSVGDEW